MAVIQVNDKKFQPLLLPMQIADRDKKGRSNRSIRIMQEKAFIHSHSKWLVHVCIRSF